MNEDMQLQVYRIVQEALTNTEKHAKAREALVVVHMKNSKNKTAIPIKPIGEWGVLFVGISDDGRGFSVPSQNPGGSQNKGHLGLRGMYQRAAILGGSLSIKSDSDGTHVYLEAPLHEE
jgi:signal transduction histidine kinase